MEQYRNEIWSLTLGLLSIVLAFMSPLFGLIAGIAGLIVSRKTMLAEKSKKAFIGFWLSIAGIAASVVMYVANIFIFSVL